MPLFHKLGALLRKMQPLGDVIGEMIASHRNDGRVKHSVLDEDGQIAGAASDVTNHHPHLSLGIRQNSFSRSERAEHPAIHGDPGCIDAHLQILQSGCSRSDDVRFDLQPVAVHTDGGFDAFLSIHNEAPRNDMHNVFVVRQCNRAGGFNRPGDIPIIDRLSGNSHHPGTIHGRYLRPRERYQG